MHRFRVQLGDITRCLLDYMEANVVRHTILGETPEGDWICEFQYLRARTPQEILGEVPNIKDCQGLQQVSPTAGSPPYLWEFRPMSVEGETLGSVDSYSDELSEHDSDMDFIDDELGMEVGEVGSQFPMDGW